MKKNIKLLALAPMILVSGSVLTSCGESADILYLRVINSEDYIYLQEDPADPVDLVVQFEQYVKTETDLLSRYPQYKDIKVVYDTSDTNETLFSELQTGKSNYDLMNVSDYMAQKIVSGGMADPLYQHELSIPNYETYASKEIKSRLDNIVATQYDYSSGERVAKHIPLKDYAVGYMWGTLGILFNPEYPSFASRGISPEEVIDDMQDFGSLWNSKYNGTISIKNSMRDTYALGVMETFRDEFQGYKDTLDAAKAEYEESSKTEEDLEKYEAALAEYKQNFSKRFNSSDAESVNKVKNKLDELKNNIFGLEVDSGKQDIITKKIGVNLAWSGDAVYSMDQGEDLTQVTEEVTLCYAVPELGSNIWMDAWIMPHCSRSDAQYEAAHMFLDFLSNPDNAAQNMNYTGYTSFIGGDTIIDLVRDWYDDRTEEVYYGDDSLPVYYADEASQDFGAVDYNTDFFTTRDNSKDEYLLYAFEAFEDEALPEDERLIEEPRTYEELIEHSEIVPLLDEEGEEVVDEEDNLVQKKYQNLLLVDEECEEVDLTYFFDGTGLDTYGEDDMVFYSSIYLPYSKLDEEGNPTEEQNISVGRQFFCQYPSKDVIDRCAVMEDYAENNTNVMKMWENFKSDPLPVWAIVTFAILGAGLLGFVGLLVTNNVLKKQTKKKRVEK